jgi:hypothetical protein
MLKFFICIKDNVSTCQICDDLGQNSQSSSNDAKSRLKYLFIVYYVYFRILR